LAVRPEVEEVGAGESTLRRIGASGDHVALLRRRVPPHHPRVALVADVDPGLGRIPGRPPRLEETDAAAFGLVHCGLRMRLPVPDADAGVAGLDDVGGRAVDD